MDSVEDIVIREGGEDLWRGPDELTVEQIGRGTAWRVELAVPPDVGLGFQAVRQVDVEASPARRAPAVVQAVDVRGAAGGALTRVLLRGKGRAPGG